MMIKDKEVLKNLYVYIFNKIAAIQVHLFQAIFCYEFDMQKEIEPVVDSLWRIEGGLRKYIYPEPLLYGWDFKFDGTEDWKKLLRAK